MHLGPYALTFYAAAISLGAFVASLVAAYLARKNGINPTLMVAFVVTCVLGGIVGARIYYVLLNAPHFMLHPLAVFGGNGRSIQGGIVGGAIAGVIFCRKTGIPVLFGCDVAGVVVPLGQAIGRWGNFFNSEAFGLPVSASFPIKLYIDPLHRPSKYIMDSFFHPTFLYESLWDFLIVAFALILWRKLRLRPGLCLVTYVALYSLGRLFIESIRTDSIMWGPIPAASLVSILSLAVSLPWIVVMLLRPPRQASPSPEPALRQRAGSC